MNETLIRGGVILEPLDPSLIFAGGVGDDLPDVLESGDWTPYLPSPERQSKWGLETMNCVQFSRLNASEFQANFYGKPLNLSDRFLYWASGCTERGNTFGRCDAGLRKCGCPDESSWPWLTAMTREQYGVEPPADVQKEALELLEGWDIGILRWVPNHLDDMKAALKKSPLWFCNQTHAMVIYAIDDRLRVWDTYNDCIGSFPLEYVTEIEAIYNCPFTPKGLKPITMPTVQIQDNAQVFEAEGLGRLGLKITAVSGQQYIVVDEAALVVSQFISRNSKGGVFSGGPSVTLKTADFDSFPHCSFWEFANLKK
jgi:hypothetical protein